MAERCSADNIRPARDRFMPEVPATLAISCPSSNLACLAS
jgi:hypothetical protein